MSISDLKPCPFCGGNDLIVGKSWSEDEPKDVIAYQVQCRDCGCSGRNTYPIGWVETQQAALEAWNDRKGELDTHVVFNAPRDMSRHVSTMRAILNEYESLFVQAQTLKSPISVHVNMLHGTIAKPTLRQMLHAYGNGALEAMETLIRTAEGGILDDEAIPALDKVRTLLDEMPKPVELA